MNPIEPKGIGKLIILGADQPQYRELPARRYTEGAIQTLWEFSDEERKAIAEGGNLSLVVYTFGTLFPPVYVCIDSLEELDLN